MRRAFERWATCRTKFSQIFSFLVNFYVLGFVANFWRESNCSISDLNSMDFSAARMPLFEEDLSSATDFISLAAPTPWRYTRLSEFQKGMLFSRFQQIQSSPERNSGTITALAKEFNISRDQFYKIVKKAQSTALNGSLKDLPRSGRAKILTAKIIDASRVLALDNQCKLSAKRIATTLRSRGMQVSDVTMQRHVNKQGWRRARAKVTPLLTQAHRHTRLSWAHRHLKRKWTAHVDIDEKYFVGWLMKATRLIPPDGHSPMMQVQHKSHIPKIMMITAVAKPNLLKNF